MDAATNRQSLMLGVPGILLQVGGAVLRAQELEIGLGVQIVGTLLLIGGLALYAKAKGHSPAWGLLGLLSILGLLILALLPDKRK